MSAILLLGLLLAANYLDFTVAQIGVAYGTNGNNLPPASRVVELYKKYCIKRMRIYEPNEATLQALRGSNIELTMSILNSQLPDVANSQADANAWVEKYVITYYPDVLFKTIVVGNEISPKSVNHQLVLRAMLNVINALDSSAYLGGQIKVTTSIGMDIVEGFPPEEGRFRDDVVLYITPIINLIVSKNTPLLANLFPYFAYINDKNKTMDLDYALLDPKYPGIKTKYNNTYQNLYYAMHDTVYAALERIIAASPEMGDLVTKPDVDGGETNVPKDDEEHDKLRQDCACGVGHVATPENAEKYVRNLIQVVKHGTPLRPDRPIPTFIFAMFDENLKPGKAEEKHFGLFRTNGTAFFNITSYC